VTGPYREEAIDELLRSEPCEIALFASLAPETFCYTLEIAVRNGIFPVALDLGAPAERIRHMGYGSVIPADSVLNIGALNDLLLKSIPESRRVQLEGSRLWRGADHYFKGPT
jgi:hypothetical protein